jgi:putative oxidoreductase
MGIGAILEMVGGGLVLIGLFTRPAAFILSGEMAVAYFQFHFPSELLAHHQRGDTGRALLLPLALHLVVGGGTVERRRGDPPKEPDRRPPGACPSNAPRRSGLTSGYHAGTLPLSC